VQTYVTHHRYLFITEVKTLSKINLSNISYTISTPVEDYLHTKFKMHSPNDFYYL